MPAGGQEEAAGHEVIEQIEKLPRADYRRRANRPRGIASCHADPLRFAHRRDQEWADTWDSSGLYRFSSLWKSFESILVSTLMKNILKEQEMMLLRDDRSKHLILIIKVN